MSRWIGIAAAGLALAASLSGPPALGATHRNVLPEAARAPPGGVRAVQVIVPQAELASNINPSIMTLAMGGGVLGVVIDAKIDNDRAKRAEAGITLLRAALGDFDADRLAVETTRSAIARTPWFDAGADGRIGFGRDASPWGENEVLNARAADAGQVAFFCYTYDTSADFSSIRVGVSIVFANTAVPAGGKPDQRLAAKNMPYVQTLTSVVNLSNPASAQENSARWAANGGALARRAIGLGFDEIAALVPRALALDEASLTGLDAGERRTLSGVSGKVVQEQAGGVLLFNGGFAHVQSIHD
jgi:hypothetical protein